MNIPERKIGYFYVTGIKEKIETWFKTNLSIDINVQMEEYNRGDGVMIWSDISTHPWKQYFSFRLHMLPGCCGVVVSTATGVGEELRGKGVANFLQEIKEDIARQNNYTTMLCTTTAQNEAQNHILPKHGWKEVDRFVNRRTGNTVVTWVKRVPYVGT